MSIPKLDHIIVLVPHETLISLPSSLTSRFSISPGGRHADGVTENKLIILPDGVYIELIAFAPGQSPAKREAHWWGKLPNGIIDFALTSESTLDVVPVRHRLEALGAGVTYAQPRAGSRKRDDGVEVKWEVTFPTSAGSEQDGALRRGSVPFWCHDVTLRELRVPRDSDDAKSHPTGARGVKEVVLGVPESKLDLYAELFGAIVGKGHSSGSQFRLGAPFGEDGSIVLQEFDEDEARVLSLKILADRDSTAINEAFNGGNKVKIEFVQ